MIYQDKELFTIFEDSRRYKIQQKRMEWISVLRLINNSDTKKENILEIGACNGGTTYTLAHFCKTLTTIDYLNPAQFTLDEIKKKCDYTYHGRSSHDVETFNLVKDKKYDVLFLDGDHTYQGVKQDFEMYSPLVNKGGIIIFHDIMDSAMHRQHNCYVSRFWDEVKLSHKDNSPTEYCFDCAEDLPYKREYMEVGEKCKEWGGIGVITI